MKPKLMWSLMLVVSMALCSRSAAAQLVEGWEVYCLQDKVSLKWTCRATKWIEDLPRSSLAGRSSLAVMHITDVGYCFSASRNTHPGRDALIRVGGNDPISYSESLVCGTVAEKIIEQLKEETDGATRGTTWPSKTHEFEFNSSGFRAAFEALQAAVASKQ